MAVRPRLPSLANSGVVFLEPKLERSHLPSRSAWKMEMWYLRRHLSRASTRTEHPSHWVPILRRTSMSVRYRIMWEVILSLRNQSLQTAHSATMNIQEKLPLIKCRETKAHQLSFLGPIGFTMRPLPVIWNFHYIHHPWAQAIRRWSQHQISL